MKDRKKKVHPLCSIVVLNYNGEKIIEKNLKALLDLNYPKNSFEIIVVDNNSQDKSAEIIKDFERNYPQIKFIALKKNIGFSAGNNIGIKSAKGKYVVLLNNDAFPDKNILKESVKVAEKEKNIFAVTFKILITDNIKTPQKPYKRFIQNAGSIVFQDGYGRDIGAVVQWHEQEFEEDRGQYDTEREIYAVCGAACLFRKKLLNKIGLLDESFFFYYEDTEISERARFAGYKLVYAPKAFVYHLHAYSSGEWSPFFIYNAEKGRLLHVFYNFPFLIFVKEYFKFTAEAYGRLFGIRGIRSIWRITQLLLYILLIIPALYRVFHREKKFIKTFKNNIQYVKISFYFFFNLPFLTVCRFQKHRNIRKKVFQENYQSIVSGRWYFN